MSDTMLEQTKRAKDQMLAAGFNRSDFSVNVEKYYIANSVKYYGKAMYEYGNANITVKSNSAYKNISNMIDAIIAAGLGVTEIQFGERKSFIISTSHNTHKVEVLK